MATAAASDFSLASTVNGKATYAALNSKTSGPYGSDEPASKKFKGANGQTTTATAARHAQIIIPRENQPAAQQASVILNGDAAPTLRKSRINRLAQMRRTNEQARPQYPDGEEQAYNILTRELVFRTTKKARDDPRYIQSGGQQSSQLYSSFNNLPEDEEPAFIGIADTPHKADKQMDQSMTNKFAVRVGGTCSAVVGPDTCHLGDPVMWDYPLVAKRPEDTQVRPCMKQEGVPQTKFLPNLKPMNFATYGSRNMARNVADYFLGTWAPPQDEETNFSRLTQLLDLQAELCLIISGERIIRATPDEQKQVIAAVVARLREIYPKRTESSFRKSAENLALAATVDLKSSLLSNLAKGLGDEKTAELVHVLKLSKALFRLVQMEIEHERCQHYAFFQRRYVGLCMQTATCQSTAIFVRAGGAVL